MPAKFSSITAGTDQAIFASSGGEGVRAETTATGLLAALVGVASNISGSADAVHGETLGLGNAISGFHKNPSSTGAAIFGEHVGPNGNAGFFKGNVVVTGDVSFPGADCAEEFTVEAEALATPGTVMALGETGELVPSAAPYEKKVVGVIAGAGSLRSGIVMGRQDNSANRRAVALVGTVYCKVDADPAPIAVGDLLTSSARQGHAMKASDQARAFGAVIGKAMAPLAEGTGLIPILIALQ
jgi:hypothetical protein